jgi:hypothetical protein
MGNVCLLNEDVDESSSTAEQVRVDQLTVYAFDFQTGEPCEGVTKAQPKNGNS